LVLSGIKAESPLKAIKGQLFLGQENFIEEIKPLTRGKEKLYIKVRFFDTLFYLNYNIKNKLRSFYHA
jgi:hypothetical protein